MEIKRKDKISVLGGTNFLALIQSIAGRSSRRIEIINASDLKMFHEIMNNQNPDLIIVSSAFLKSNKISFLQELRNRYEYIPVVVAGSKPTEAAHFLQNRVDEFYTISELVYLDFDRVFLTVLQRSLLRAKNTNMIDSLRKSLQYRTEFTAQLSHEIRNPLNGILGMVSLLKQTAMDENQKELVENIKASGDTLLGLTNDVLDISKLNAGKLKIVSEPFRIRETINQCIETFSSLVIKKNLQIGSFIDPRIPTIINGDCFRVRQVISNFVSNAIKFTETGMIVIEAKFDSENSQRIIISVRDSGLGIEKDLLAKLFLPYQQLAVEDQVKGTGLGLSICKQLAQAMGGEIGVESDPGKGSNFWFTITIPDSPMENTFSKRSVLEDKKIGVFSNAEEFNRLISEQLGERGIPFVIGPSLLDISKQNLLIFDLNTLAIKEIVKLTEMSKKANRDISFLFIGHLSEEISGIGESIMNSENHMVHLKQNILYSKICLILKLEEPQSEKSAQISMDRDDSRFLGMKILVVDDNIVNIQVAAKMLRHLGCVVETGISGKEALELLRNQEFDCIFLDYDLTDMYGFEVADDIKKSASPNQNTPIYALTGYTTEKHHTKCRESGMLGVLVKPIDLVSLKAVLQSVVDTSVTAESLPLLQKNDIGTDQLIKEVDDVDFDRIKQLEELEGDESGAFVRYILRNFSAKLETSLSNIKRQSQNDAAVVEEFRQLKNAAENLGAIALKNILIECNNTWVELSKNERETMLTLLENTAKRYFQVLGHEDRLNVQPTESANEVGSVRYHN